MPDTSNQFVVAYNAMLDHTTLRPDRFFSKDEVIEYALKLKDLANEALILSATASQYKDNIEIRYFLVRTLSTGFQLLDAYYESYAILHAFLQEFFEQIPMALKINLLIDSAKTNYLVGNNHDALVGFNKIITEHHEIMTPLQRETLLFNLKSIKESWLLMGQEEYATQASMLIIRCVAKPTAEQQEHSTAIVQQQVTMNGNHDSEESASSSTASSTNARKKRLSPKERKIIAHATARPAGSVFSSLASHCKAVEKQLDREEIIIKPK